jgi:putative flippase GtrA
MGISLFISSAIGYSAGLLVSYHFGRIWVFGRKFEMSKQNVTRFAIVYAVGGFGMSALIELLDKTSGIDYRISWLFGAGFAVINNFLGLKWFVFNRSEASNGN